MFLFLNGFGLAFLYDLNYKAKYKQARGPAAAVRNCHYIEASRLQPLVWSIDASCIKGGCWTDA